MKICTALLLVAPLMGQQALLKSGITYSIQLTGAVSRETAFSFVCGADRFSKTFNAGDNDWTFLFRPSADCRYNTRLKATVTSYGITNNVEIEPNGEHSKATPIQLGAVVFATGDNANYLGNVQDEDWYRFRFEGGKPRLIGFQVDLMERDNLPVDV